MNSQDGFLATANKIFDRVANAVHSPDPSYQRLKYMLDQEARMIVLCGRVTGAATALFALIALTALSPVAFVLGILSGFVTYNSLAIASNLAKIAQNPARYFAAYGLGDGLNEVLLKKDLSQGTWQFEWLINYGVDVLNNAMLEDAKKPHAR